MTDLPHDIAAEQAVLGGLMLSPSSLPRVDDLLKPEDFYDRRHAAIYEAMQAQAGEEFDAITLADWFASAGKMAMVDDGAYLVELATTTPSAANVAAYAEIVKAKSTQRRGIQIGTELADRFRNPKGMDVPQIAAAATVELSELTNTRKGDLLCAGDAAKEWFAWFQKRHEDGDALRGIPTPWSEYSERIGGLEDGCLYIDAGRPGMGKSAKGVVQCVETAIARPDEYVLLYSLEMNKRQIMSRMISHVAQVPLDYILNPSHRKYAQDADTWMPRITAAIKAIKSTKLHIDDTPGISIAQLASRSRRMHMRGRIALITVDHIHIMGGNRDNPVSWMTEISGGLKRLSKELSCPVQALAQLNRSVEGRQDKRPMLSDLRESGSIEQDADVITFIYRDEYYYKEQSQQKGNVELIVAKNREGETGTVNVRSNLAYGGIIDYERGAPSFDAPVKPEYGGF